jgi:hypothetical protein
MSKSAQTPAAAKSIGPTSITAAITLVASVAKMFFLNIILDIGMLLDATAQRCDGGAAFERLMRHPSIFARCLPMVRPYLPVKISAVFQGAARSQPANRARCEEIGWASRVETRRKGAPATLHHNHQPPPNHDRQCPQSHNHRFHQNCPIPKSAAGLQQTLSFWLYRSLEQRVWPTPLLSPPRLV